MSGAPLFLCAGDTDDFSQRNQQVMTFASRFRTLRHNIEHAAVGVGHFAMHIVDEGFSTVKALGGDVVQVAHSAERGSVRGVKVDPLL